MAFVGEDPSPSPNRADRVLSERLAQHDDRGVAPSGPLRVEPCHPVDGVPSEDPVGVVKQDVKDCKIGPRQSLARVIVHAGKVGGQFFGTVSSP